MDTKSKMHYPMNMSREKLEATVENEKEWRREILGQVTEMRREFNDFRLETTKSNVALKIKVSLMGIGFGSLGGLVYSLISRLTIH